MTEDEMQDRITELEEEADVLKVEIERLETQVGELDEKADDYYQQVQRLEEALTNIEAITRQYI